MNTSWKGAHSANFSQEATGRLLRGARMYLVRIRRVTIWDERVKSSYRSDVGRCRCFIRRPRYGASYYMVDLTRERLEVSVGTIYC